MDSILATLLTGLLLTLLGAAAGAYFTRRHERGTRLEQARLRIYVMLLELKQTHFPISAGDMPEIPERAISPESKERYWEGAWKVLEELRTVDDLPQLPDIVDAVLGLGFEHEWQRAESFAKIIESLGQEVSPRFVAALHRRDRAAQELMARDGDEWWRRRGKIEPWISTSMQRERARRRRRHDEVAESGDDEETD